MSRKFGSEEELARAVGELPRSLEPSRDLWPDIEARLPERDAERARHPDAGIRPGRFAMAALVLIAFATGILLGRHLDQEGPSAPGGVQVNMALRAALQASEKEYQAAFRQFIPVGTAQTMLAPQAVESIENSWLELQQAEAALLAALAEHPENTYLNQKLLDLRAQQLEFLQQLATLDQFSRRKT